MNLVLASKSGVRKQILNKFEKIGVTEDDLRTLGILNVFNYK